MSYELVGIILLGIMGLIQMGGLVYLNRSFQDQLRRNLFLEAQFQRWNAEKLDSITQRLDEVLDILRRGQL
ncbi:MAG: hypothetical protein ACK4Z6_05775 [Candidatus Methylomirabilales bacterium]